MENNLEQKRRLSGSGRGGFLRGLFRFLAGNWVVILIIAMFISQVYLVLEVRKLAASAKMAENQTENSLSDDLNQVKTMMSSLFSRVGTMQGDLNYLKSRR